MYSCIILLHGRKPKRNENTQQIKTFLNQSNLQKLQLQEEFILYIIQKQQQQQQQAAAVQRCKQYLSFIIIHCWCCTRRPPARSEACNNKGAGRGGEGERGGRNSDEFGTAQWGYRNQTGTLKRHLSVAVPVQLL